MQVGVRVSKVGFSCFDGAAGRLPGVETAAQGIGLGESLVAKLLRRTGAGLFLGSRSVDHREAVFGPRRINAEFTGVHADSAADFDVTGAPGLLGAGVQNGDGLPRLQSAFEIVRVKSNRSHGSLV